MKKAFYVLLLITLLCSVTLMTAAAEERILYSPSAGIYHELSEPLPTITSVQIGGRYYLLDLSQQASAPRSGECETCDMQLGNRAPDMDGWYRYSPTQHQYRTYYHATCSVCKKHSYVYTAGQISQHIWRYVSDKHAYGTMHAIVERCNVCGETMTSYVFCPGPDGGGCTVVTSVTDKPVTE